MNADKHGQPDKGQQSPSKPNPAKESLRQEQREQKRESKTEGKDAELDRALEDTFPASDPIALQTPTQPGARKHS